MSAGLCLLDSLLAQLKPPFGEDVALRHVTTARQRKKTHPLSKTLHHFPITSGIVRFSGARKGIEEMCYTQYRRPPMKLTRREAFAFVCTSQVCYKWQGNSGPPYSVDVAV